MKTSSLVKIAVALAVVYALWLLRPLLMMLALALMVAVALYPAIRWQTRRGLSHGASVLVVTAVLFGAIAATTLVIAPTLREQVQMLLNRWPEIEESVWLRRLMKNPGAIDPKHVVTVGEYVLGALSQLVLTLVLALYLAAEGSRTYRWLRGFFAPLYHPRIDQTAREVAEVVFAYVAGQFITSVLCALYVFAVLTILKVPAALVLALMAGVFDILPVLGFFLFAVPAALFAWTVSAKTALTVVALYVAYHLLENYLIVPKVYGNRMRLSDLVVLVAVLAGAYLGGILGAILILPVVAAYPTIERLWLVDILGRGVVQRHVAIEEEPAR